MATVYLAQDLKHDRKVALKVGAGAFVVVENWIEEFKAKVKK